MPPIPPAPRTPKCGTQLRCGDKVFRWTHQSPILEPLGGKQKTALHMVSPAARPPSPALPSASLNLVAGAVVSSIWSALDPHLKTARLSGSCRQVLEAGGTPSSGARTHLDATPHGHSTQQLIGFCTYAGDGGFQTSGDIDGFINAVRYPHCEAGGGNAGKQSSLDYMSDMLA